MNLKEDHKQFFENLKPGDIVLFKGDVGAGKTTLIRSAIEYLASKKQVASDWANSPSYNLIHEYPIGDQKYIHMDLYRAETDDELESFGFWEALEDRQNIFFIEWPERVSVQEISRPSTYEVEIRWNQNQREYSFKKLR